MKKVTQVLDHHVDDMLSHTCKKRDYIAHQLSNFYQFSFEFKLFHSHLLNLPLLFFSGLPIVSFLPQVFLLLSILSPFLL